MNNKVDDYLTSRLLAASGQNAELWRELQDFYNKKLWHQLTVKLHECIKSENFTGSENMTDIYENFIKDFEHRANPLTMTEIYLFMSKLFSDPEQGVKFLETARTVVKANEEAVILCLVGIADLKLSIRDKSNRCPYIREVKQILEEAQPKLDALEGVTKVHGPYYKTSSVYLREIGDYAAYYREALRYLGCTDVDRMTTQDKALQAFCLGLAALLGENVYNFGELLAHPILSSLKGTAESWLVDLLFAFNSGDLKKFESLRPVWSKQDDLRNQSALLERKIRLLCLMEMAFARHARDRQISFDEISKTAGIPMKDVEMLVMKALSLNLAKGYIDEVEQKVSITWVQPRVLDKKQIGNMADRFDQWCKEVKNVSKTIEESAEDILTQN